MPRPGSTNQPARERLHDLSLRCLFEEVESVTTITRISKQSSIFLPSGFSLKAMADTRFHTLCDSLAANPPTKNKNRLTGNASTHQYHGRDIFPVQGLDQAHADFSCCLYPYSNTDAHCLRGRLLSLRIDFARLPRLYPIDIEVDNAADRLLSDALAEVSTFNDEITGYVGFKIHPLHCAALLLHPLTRSLQKLDNRTKLIVDNLGNAMLQELMLQTPTVREYTKTEFGNNGRSTHRRLGVSWTRASCGRTNVDYANGLTLWTTKKRWEALASMKS
jgi:hypothetical protein